MRFTQYYLGCLSQASYLIGDEATGRAAVIDPRRDVADYIDDTAAAGLRIEYVIETHVHADFLSGHQELAALTGATVIYGADADIHFPHREVGDGERINLGRVVLEFRATPGHTPESISIGVAGIASRLTASQLAEARAEIPDLVVLDVRGPGERAQGCVGGSVHIPLAELGERMGELNPAQPVVAYCAAGYRSSIAASLLRARGFADVSDLIGGYQAWAAA